MSRRLKLAAEAGLLSGLGRTALFGAPADLDMGCFGASELTVIQPMMPDAARWQERGIEVEPQIDLGDFSQSVVFLPRARAEARARVASAVAVTGAGGTVLIDGQKTDGIEAMLKEMRGRTSVDSVISKAHGKLFAAETGADFTDWVARPTEIAGRWQTLPGVFSADGIDPGSALLAAVLPEDLSGCVIDLGAGWGYLTGTLLERAPRVRECHLIEAHAAALQCARRNVPDPRARFHWADAATWQINEVADHVIMNPPFHTARNADTALGQGFISAAARHLRPKGTLWMVANRHLPYEKTLAELFAETREIGGDGSYKVFRSRARS